MHLRSENRLQKTAIGQAAWRRHCRQQQQLSPLTLVIGHSQYSCSRRSSAASCCRSSCCFSAAKASASCRQLSCCCGGSEAAVSERAGAAPEPLSSLPVGALLPLASGGTLPRRSSQRDRHASKACCSVLRTAPAQRTPELAALHARRRPAAEALPAPATAVCTAAPLHAPAPITACQALWPAVPRAAQQAARPAASVVRAVPAAPVTACHTRASEVQMVCSAIAAAWGAAGAGSCTLSERVRAERAAARPLDGCK